MSWFDVTTVWPCCLACASTSSSRDPRGGDWSTWLPTWLVLNPSSLRALATFGERSSSKSSRTLGRLERAVLDPYAARSNSNAAMTCVTSSS